MKTAIFLPEEIFEAAGSLAREMGMSRDQLCSLAVAEFLSQHRSDDVTRTLDAIYAPGGAAPGDGLDPVLAEMQARTTASPDDDDW